MHIYINKKRCEINLSTSAKSQLNNEQELFVEMELYFSCLIRKRVYISLTPRAIDYVQAPGNLLDSKLHIGFRPVMTEKCSMDYTGDEPPVTDFPITGPERFTPAWLLLDYKNRQWQGEFGYT